MNLNPENEAAALTPRKARRVHAGLTLLMLVIGSLQAWDSHVQDANALTVLLVILAIALPAAAMLVPLRAAYFGASGILALILLVVARIISPVPLPGLFLILIPTAISFIFVGLSERGEGQP
jgi:hypothetical protein